MPEDLTPPLLNHVLFGVKAEDGTPIEVEPSYTGPYHPEGPAGPDWWRWKGGWDRFAADNMELARAIYRLGEVERKRNADWVPLMLKRYKACIREMNYLQRKVKQLDEIRERFVVLYASQNVRLREAEEAIKRGQLALNEGEWAELQRQSRLRLSKKLGQVREKKAVKARAKKVSDNG